MPKQQNLIVNTLKITSQQELNSNDKYHKLAALKVEGVAKFKKGIHLIEQTNLTQTSNTNTEGYCFYKNNEMHLITSTGTTTFSDSGTYQKVQIDADNLCPNAGVHTLYTITGDPSNLSGSSCSINSENAITTYEYHNTTTDINYIYIGLNVSSSFFELTGNILSIKQKAINSSQLADQAVEFGKISKKKGQLWKKIKEDPVRFNYYKNLAKIKTEENKNSNENNDDDDEIII